ncbi:hypothetical protein BVC80_1405g7 [Macleaya cordata]|uniref:Uncharacterized protein n=1 Tax=Macleaya cordata TaxID=56857 RepID=A0A200QED2_MACCD|nr:hypothetical protein BVC80_1405g7 [Macleaya cordata]
MFAHHSRPAEQEATKKLYNTRMVEGTQVRDHVLTMMALFNELETLRTTFKQSYKEDFKMTYNMNKMSSTLPDLMNQLTVAEGIMKGQKTGSVNIA